VHQGVEGECAYVALVSGGNELQGLGGLGGHACALFVTVMLLFNFLRDTQQGNPARECC